jgi:thiol-disulfide isomerase/thioredoxin
MCFVPQLLPLLAGSSLRLRARAGFLLKVAMLVVVMLFAARTSAWAADLAPSLTVPQKKGGIEVYLFWGEGCSHCDEEKRFLSDLEQGYPELEVRMFEVLRERKNLNMLIALMDARGKQASGVPVTFIGDRVFEGFSKPIQAAMEGAIKECRERSCPDPAAVLKGRDYAGAMQRLGRTAAPAGAAEPAFASPLFGGLDLRSASLPLLTIAIAGLDSFNPCAFFVLLSLLGLLVHGGSRSKMMAVGGAFVFMSGFVYFLFMAAWLNLFFVMGNLSAVTTTAGVLSVAIAAVNIKDFFAFKKGISLTLSSSAKPRLFDRIRRLLRSTSFFPVLAGTIVLAILANFYELMCTAGFPMVFTRILTLNARSLLSSYLYLVLYNVVRVIPLFAIVLAFTITLSSRKLTERHARVLKLLAGTMMLGLGAVLLIEPVLLNSLLSSLVLVAGAIGFSLVLAIATRRLGYL